MLYFQAMEPNHTTDLNITSGKIDTAIGEVRVNVIIVLHQCLGMNLKTGEVSNVKVPTIHMPL